MATLAVTNPTLLDFMQSLGPDNRVARVIELMAQTNEWFQDAVTIEGNLLTGHQTTVRTGIPTPTWRKMYGGVQPSKTTRVKITDAAGMLENYSEIDAALADLNGQAPAFMMSESRGILEGFNQEVTRTFFYGNEGTQPEAFTGLAPRFNSLSAENASNILVGGGAGSTNTSIWLVVWSEETAHLFYPQGSTGGIKVTDKGQVTVENVDGAGGRMEAYRTHFRWDVGFSLRDWRYVVRIPNIDVTTLTKNASAGADLVDLLAQAVEIVHSTSLGRPALYANRTIKSFLRRQIANKVASSTLMMENVGGKHVMTFDGIPVRRVDALLNTEATVA